MLLTQVYHRYMHTVALRRRRNRGPPLGRPASTRSDMGPRQTAVDTLSYSTDLAPKLRSGRASAKTIGTGVCERPCRGGPRCGPRLDQRSSGPVGGDWPSAKTGFLDAEPTPSRFPADRRGDQDVVGSHRLATFFSLRLRVAQHFTHKLAAET